MAAVLAAIKISLFRVLVVIKVSLSLEEGGLRTRPASSLPFSVRPLQPFINKIPPLATRC